MVVYISGAIRAEDVEVEGTNLKISEEIWEKIEKQGNRWKNVWEAAMEKTCRLPTAQSAHQTPVRAAYSHNSPYPGRRRSARGQASEIACIFHI